jgi:ADP-ribosylglycohydrolase
VAQPDTRWLEQRVLGCLMVAALGDALGAATETYTRQEITTRFGGPVRELHTPAADTPAAGHAPGRVTDDASQMFALARLLADSDGELDVDIWRETLAEWLRSSPEADLAGPSTRRALEPGSGERHAWRDARVGATNGAAMRVAPAGLVLAGDPAGAVDLAWLSCQPTHDTQVAAAGAGAIAAGVAAALDPDADVLSVARACRRGAQLGEAVGAERGRCVPSASVARRIDLAISVALRAATIEEALEEIDAVVGTSVMVVESVPAAVGLFVATGGQPFEVVTAAASVGNDSDTIATMAGALAGALRGLGSVPHDLVQQVREANDVDIDALAADLTSVVVRTR